MTYECRKALKWQHINLVMSKAKIKGIDEPHLCVASNLMEAGGDL